MQKAFVPLDKGLNYSVPRFMVPESQFSAGINAHFCKGYVEKVGGWRKYFPSPLNGEVRHMESFYTSSGDSFLMFHTPSKLYKFVGGDTAPVDVTGAALTASATLPVSSDTIQDYYIFTNGVDNIMFWDGSGTSKKLPGAITGAGWAANTAYVKGNFVTEGSKNYLCTVSGTSGSGKPTFPTSGTVSDGSITWYCLGPSGLVGGYSNINSCRFVVSYNGFLIAGNTVEDGIAFPQRLRWSKWDNCMCFNNNADGSGQAGWLNTDGVDWLQNAKPLSDYLVVYKERSIIVLSYVGGDDIFSAKRAISGVGLIATNAVIDLGDEHIFIGPDNIYSFDLLEPKTAGDDIRDEFFRLLDPQYTDNIKAFFIEEVPEAYFTFTSINSTSHTNDYALIYNTDTKAWSIRELPMTAFGYYRMTTSDQWDNDYETWDSDTSKWDDARNITNAPLNLCADRNGYVYEFVGNSQDGADFGFSLETGLMALENPMILKRLKRIQFMVSREGEYSLTVTIGTAENVEEDVSWRDPVYMSLNKAGSPWVDVDVTGRYFIIRLSNSEKDQPVKLMGMILTYENRGGI